METGGILGHERVLERLQHADAENHLHHCYLFEGPEGVGKRRVAELFARYLNCEAAARPCGECRPCRMILAGSHPDVLLIGPDPTRTTVVITAAQARGIVSALQLQRHSARRRTVIIDPADALTEEAGNVLLKTFEEPPAGTQFILVTARPAALLQTVRSRSQRVRFGPLPVGDVAAWLVARGLDPALARGALGSPGEALRLAEGQAQARADMAQALAEVVSRPVPTLFAFSEGGAKKAEGGAERAALVVDVLEEMLRDAVCVAAGRRDAVLHQAQLPTIERWAVAMWPGGFARMGSLLSLSRQRARINVNGRVIVEALLGALNLELSQS